MPLITTALIPAGTSGDSVLSRGLAVEWEPEVELSLPAELLVYDPRYLRGRVAIADILPGRFLGKANFCEAEARIGDVCIDPDHVSVLSCAPGQSLNTPDCNDTAMELTERYGFVLVPRR